MKKSIITFAVLLMILLAGCAAKSGESSSMTFTHADTGETLTLGMTPEEIGAVLGEPVQDEHDERLLYYGEREDSRFTVIYRRGVATSMRYAGPGPWVVLGGMFTENSTMRSLAMTMGDEPHFTHSGILYYLFDAEGKITENPKEADKLLLFCFNNQNRPDLTMIQLRPNENPDFSFYHPDSGAAITLGMTQSEISAVLGEEPVPHMRAWETPYDENDISFTYWYYAPPLVYEKSGVLISAVGELVLEIQTYRDSPLKTTLGNASCGDIGQHVDDAFAGKLNFAPFARSRGGDVTAEGFIGLVAQDSDGELEFWEIGSPDIICQLGFMILEGRVVSVSLAYPSPFI